MKRFLRRAAAVLLLGLALGVPVCATGAAAAPEGDPFVRLEAGAEETIEFVPPANSEYAVYLFSAGKGEAEGSAELTLNGETVIAGAGSGALCSAWLVAGERYVLRVRSDEPAMVEIARSALSRCFDQPLPVEENVPGGKMIARAYDAHWYEFEASAVGRLMFTCVPEEPGMELRAALFDESGAMISELEALPGGACMLLTRTRANRRYYLRVCAPGGQTGYYFLTIHRRAEDTITSALRFEEEEPQTLAAGSAVNLAERLRGEALLWASDAPEVAAVAQDGTAVGLAPGAANITAYGMNSQAVCRVEVVDVPLEGLRVLNSPMQLAVGDEVEVAVARAPRNASERGLRFSIADPAIASVTEAGVVTGLAPGETRLTVTNPSGEISAEAVVHVEPAGRRYRALLVGEQNYPFGVNAERTGSENSVAALAGLLESGRFSVTDYEVRARADLSRAELIAEIRSAFGDAAGGDVSLLYVTCHGSYTGGMSFLELSDGSKLSARDLERELRRVRGTVVAMIDCCGSGGAIGAASERAAFARGITGAFSGAAIRGSRYRVLCSAGLDEDSFRLAFNGESGAGTMATVFARALCDGAGWNLDRNARGTMGADDDYDGAVTLEELARYMAGRVDWYLDRASELTGTVYRQSVHVYPEGDPFVLFE